MLFLHFFVDFERFIDIFLITFWFLLDTRWTFLLTPLSGIFNFMLFWAVGSVPTWDVGGTKKEPILTGMQIFMLLELRKHTHIEAVKGEMADGLLRKFQKNLPKTTQIQCRWAILLLGHAINCRIPWLDSRFRVFFVGILNFLASAHPSIPRGTPRKCD